MAHGFDGPDIQPVLRVIENSAKYAAKNGAAAAAMAAAQRGVEAVIGSAWSGRTTPMTLPARPVADIEARKLPEIAASILMLESHGLHNSAEPLSDSDVDNAARMLLNAISASGDMQLVFDLLGAAGATVSDRAEMRGRISAQMDRTREIRQRGRPAR